MNSGIYRIINTINNNSYIGSTSNFKNRFCSHKGKLMRREHPNPHLQSAWNLYGEDVFRFDILLYCSVADLELYEQLLIDSIKPNYNIRVVAKSNRGMKSSELTKRKIGDSLRGRKQTPVAIENSRLARVGKPILKLRGVVVPKERRDKISKTLMGHPVSTKVRERLRSLFTGTPNYKNAKTYYGIVSPNGCIYESVTNLTQFCKEHGLSQGLMSKVVRGERHHHRNWTVLDSKHTNIVTGIDISEIE